jgi:hypothetical protein
MAVPAGFEGCNKLFNLPTFQPPSLLAKGDLLLGPMGMKYRNQKCGVSGPGPLHTLMVGHSCTHSVVLEQVARRPPSLTAPLKKKDGKGAM